MRHVARPVAAVVLLVLAVVLGFAAVMNVPGASADPGTPNDEVNTSESPSDTDDDPGEDESDSDPDPDPSDPDPSDPDPSETDPTDDPPETDPTDEPSDEPTDDTEVEVKNAVFRWGMSNQSNAHSHNPMPRAINFFSAGVANPGGADTFLPETRWKAKQGNVVIQKLVGKKYQTATWDGLGTASDNKTKINSSSIFSGHNVVIRRGVGTVNAATKEATISWKGTFTVLYYGGYTMFTVTDPELTVKNGVGRVTAELGGYATSRDGGGWKKVTPDRVRIADLGKVDLSKDGGFSVKPEYKGVKVTGSAKQDTNGPDAGAFPQPMITFLHDMGDIDQFWYSTGGSTDKTKAASELTISYDEANEVAPTSTPSPTTDEPTIDNPLNDPPPDQVGPASQEQAAAPAPAAQAPGLPAQVPESQRELLTPADLGEVKLASAAPADENDVYAWWLGGALLLLAAGLLVIPVRSKP